MERIYSKAQTVYIDLGDVGELQYQGIDLLHQLSLLYDRGEPFHRKKGASLLANVTLERYP